MAKKKAKRVKIDTERRNGSVNLVMEEINEHDNRNGEWQERNGQLNGKD